MEYLTSKLPLPGQKQAQLFIMRCVQRGVPPPILMTEGIVQIYSAEALGMGSPDERQNITNQLVMMKGAADEKGRRWVDRQWAAARIGSWNVDKMFPKDSRDKVPDNATSVAVLENNSALDGRAPQVGSDQPHGTHATTHLAPLARYAEAFTKFGLRGIPNLAEASQAFKLLLPHLEQHVQIMGQDPSRKAQMKMWIQTLQQLAQIGHKLIKAADQMQQMQIQQQQDSEQGGGPMNPEMQLKMQKMMMEMQLENKKQDSLNAMRQQKTADGSAIKAQQAQANAQLAAQRAAAELAMEKTKVEAEIALDAAKAAAKAQQAVGGI